VSGNKSIIVRKVKKAGHGGHHGGSWKVAYADFVTAMMAFFLLLWLITMTSPEKRARISSYFKEFSLFNTGGSSIMEKTSSMFSEAGPTNQKAFKELPDETTMNEINPEKLQLSLEKGIAERLGDLKDQVKIDITEEGVRIQLMDKKGSLMFEKGKSTMTPKAKEILRIVAENIKPLTNKVVIEGHTDAVPYSGRQYSNWELSTERASSARRELEANGLDSSRIARVAGYADTDPLIKENPRDPRNRRISITLQIPRKKSITMWTASEDIHPPGADNVSIDLPARGMDKETGAVVGDLMNHKTWQVFSGEANDDLDGRKSSSRKRHNVSSGVAASQPSSASNVIKELQSPFTGGGGKIWGPAFQGIKQPDKQP
jgi:chemotaxis protein MotB